MSPNQLIPSQPYTLSYYLTDPSDSNTYYVRAVVYDAITGAVLDTQNLTQQTTNSHLFSKVAQAPGDSSGHGRRIVVVATAYTDTGYTVKADTYREQSENYIVIKAGAGLSLGGGGGVDYRIIQEIVQTENEKFVGSFKLLFEILKGVSIAISKIPVDSVELEPVTEILSKVSKEISQIPKKLVDILPIVELVNQAIQAINEKEITKKTDIQPLIDHLTELKDSMSLNHTESKDLLGLHMNDLQTIIPSLLKENISKSLKNAKLNVNLPVSLDTEEVPVEPKKLPDINKLI